MGGMPPGVIACVSFWERTVWWYPIGESILMVLSIQYLFFDITFKAIPPPADAGYP